MSEQVTQQGLYEQMRADFAQRTGFYMEDNDDLAARLWAVAAQLAALRTENEWSGRQAFPQTAEGTYLDWHGQMRGLTRQAGTHAQGVLRMSLDTAMSDDVEIAAGTVCTDEALVRFVTLEAATIPAGQTYVDVAAQAEQPGLAGNAAPGTVCFWTLPPVSVSGVTNPAAFAGGSEPESDAAFRSRILDSYHRLPNGANAAWYEARTLAVEGVAEAVVLPRWQGIGTVGVVIAGADGTADAALIGRVAAVLEAAREIATDVTVMAAEAVPVDVTAQITVSVGYEESVVLLAVRTALTQYFDGSLLGRPLYRAALGRVIYGVEGVENYALTAPAADVAITQRQIPTLGTLSVTEAET